MNSIRTMAARLQKAARSQHFWIVAGMLAACTLLHYFTPQERVVPLLGLSFTRHTIERIVFLLPVAAAAFAFSQTGGLLTLALALAIMIPRALLVSVQPADSVVEVLGIGVVGYLLVWMIEATDRERKLRLKVVRDLEILNTISSTLCQSLEMDAMLARALGKVLDVLSDLKPSGAILLLDPWRGTLKLRAAQGLAPESVAQASEVPLGECLCGLVAESSHVLVVPNSVSDPRHTRCLVTTPHSHVCIPLTSRQRLVGIIDLFLGNPNPADAIDEQLFMLIGRQIGVAVENARLCENLRFYLGQLTQAQESERQRIARDLHDETIQGLIDLSRQIDGLEDSLEDLPGAPVGQLESLQERIEKLLGGVRRFSQDLRPSILDDLGLIPAVDWLMADLREHGIEPELVTVGKPRRLDPDVELALFRIVQEALSNVKRHAGASKVTTTVRFYDSRVRLSVQDDGRGFKPPQRMTDLVASRRFGLVGIEERVTLLGGRVQILSELSKGTMLVVDTSAAIDNGR